MAFGQPNEQKNDGVYSPYMGTGIDAPKDIAGSDDEMRVKETQAQEINKLVMSHPEIANKIPHYSVRDMNPSQMGQVLYEVEGMAKAEDAKDLQEKLGGGLGLMAGVGALAAMVGGGDKKDPNAKDASEQNKATNENLNLAESGKDAAILAAAKDGKDVVPEQLKNLGLEKSALHPEFQQILNRTFLAEIGEIGNKLAAAGATSHSSPPRQAFVPESGLSPDAVGMTDAKQRDTAGGLSMAT
ncbi:MAG: hypothetical protein R3D71_08660 [Rickettsiales bacterium]